MPRPKVYPDGEHGFAARIPLDTWDKLEESARRNLRSVNAELVWILREHFTPKRARRRADEAKDGADGE